MMYRLFLGISSYLLLWPLILPSSAVPQSSNGSASTSLHDDVDDAAPSLPEAAASAESSSSFLRRAHHRELGGPCQNWCYNHQPSDFCDGWRHCRGCPECSSPPCESWCYNHQPSDFCDGWTYCVGCPECAPTPPPPTAGPTQLPTPVPSTRPPTTAAIVNNNVRWYDSNNGIEINSNDGGHITKLDNGLYYWVGNDLRMAENGNDIHLYSSQTLGSSDWYHEGKMYDFNPGHYNGNANLLYNSITQKYVIITKGLDFYQSDNVNGPYSLEGHVWPYLWPPNSDPDTPNRYRWGGMSVYQEGNDAYLVVSRFDSDRLPETRAMFIYKFTSDYLNIEEEIYWSGPDDKGQHREAPYIFQKEVAVDESTTQTLYYMTMSHTRGWKPTETYYWTAESLSGPWTNRDKVGMVGSSNNARSHNSQHRYIMKVGDNDQWIFGGDRYPYHEPSFYPEEQGQNIMCNVIWDNTYNPPRPVVVFNSTWTFD